MTEPGFDTGLDLARDTLDEAETEALVRWYETSHGEGNTDLTRFVPFLIRHSPATLKRYRAYAQSIHESTGLPQAGIALMWLHHYMLIGNERGVLYQVIAARHWGATKREVLDVVRLTFLEAGPLGLNAVAELAEEYLDRWPDDEPRRVERAWPESWQTAGEALPPVALERETTELTEADLAAIEGDYRRRGVDVPVHVRMLAARAPALLKTMRGRYAEALAGSQVPAQLIPLFHLHTAAIRVQPELARRAAEDARTAGVSAAHVVGALGFAFLYMTDAAMELVVSALADLLDSWADG